jgi:thymidine kinase
MSGRLTVITGPMASGKTISLIDKLRREIIAGGTVILFKHEVDTRCDVDIVASRFGLSWPALSVPHSGNIWSASEGYSVVGIEEAQFFDVSLEEIITRLTDVGIDVYVTGLNQDFRGEPFGIMPTIMAMADDIILLKSVCSVCGNDASKTQRIVNGSIARFDEPTILVGGDETYEPRCHLCWERPQ